LAASTYVASCACSIATPHDVVTSTSITVSFLSLLLIRMENSTIPQAVFDICRRLHLSSQPSQDLQCCMSCQHRHSCSLRTSTRIPLFTIVSDSDFQIPAHPSLSLRGQDQEECHRQSLLSNPFTAIVMTELDGVHGTVCNKQQYQQSLQSQDSRSPWISCLTHWDIIGLTVSI
jgi:hypothetical protein